MSHHVPSYSAAGSVHLSCLTLQLSPGLAPRDPSIPGCGTTGSDLSPGAPPSSSSLAIPGFSATGSGHNVARSVHYRRLTLQLPPGLVAVHCLAPQDAAIPGRGATGSSHSLCDQPPPSSSLAIPGLGATKSDHPRAHCRHHLPRPQRRRLRRYPSSQC